jgi:hypothetical protein
VEEGVTSVWFHARCGVVRVERKRLVNLGK